jgi:twinkle protein
VGLKIEWFKFFNKKVKGIRKGELSIVSGPTGSGKTTFLSQMTVALSQKEIPVLWGSFEITNVNLATTMLYQHSRVNLVKNKHQFEYIAN